jgi:proteasome accessory factor B
MNRKQSPTKLQRHLDVIAYLVGRGVPVTVEELMENVEGYAEAWRTGDETKRDSARRMFERDKDDLRAIGIPLRSVKYSINFGADQIEGYEITRRDFYLPYLKLVQGEAAASGYSDRLRADKVEVSRDDAPLALDALRRAASIPAFPLVAEARSAFRKLAFDLDPDAFLDDTHVLFLERPNVGGVAADLRTLSDALLARRRVQFRYHGIYRDQETSRDVAGYGLLFQQSNWYLIGHDAMRDAMRVFRVDRMEEIQVAKSKKESYEIPDDFNLEDYVGRPAWELGDEDAPMVADVLFHFPQSVWAERNAHGQLIETKGDGSTVRRFSVHQVNPFLRWVLGLQGAAEILEPAQLREELRALARVIATAHAEGDHVGE